MENRRRHSLSIKHLKEKVSYILLGAYVRDKVSKVLCSAVLLEEAYRLKSIEI